MKPHPNTTGMASCENSNEERVFTDSLSRSQQGDQALSLKELIQQRNATEADPALDAELAQAFMKGGKP